jgi:hypothetical protein
VCARVGVGGGRVKTAAFITRATRDACTGHDSPLLVRALTRPWLPNYKKQYRLHATKGFSGDIA